MSHSRLRLSLPSFRSRSFQQREELISSSLISSQGLSERLASWSGSNDRDRPLEMKFKEWQHPDCPVMKWYNSQKESSTQFRSIEHWSSNEAPFFHEYLLIKLTDDNICRVERMGQGSRTDAVTWIGCTARDLIQWFPKERYDNNSFYPKPPKLLIKVDFPEPFDLLDVLAICYSIQQNKSSRSYTLQRYNCYFLCSTILAMLTRRVGERENLITEAQWTHTVRETLDDLSNAKHKDAIKFLSFGVFSLLHPESPNPSGFFVESLRSQLGGAALCNLNNERSGTLWRKDMHLAIEYGLIASINSAISAVLGGEHANAVGLRNLLPNLGEEPIPVTGPDAMLARKEVAKVLLKAYTETLKSGLQRWEERFRMRQIEARRSLRQRVASYMFQKTVIYPSAFLKGFVRFLNDSESHKIILEINRRYQVNLLQILLAFPQSKLLAAADFFLLTHDHDVDINVVISHGLEFLTGYLIKHASIIVEGLISKEPRDIQLLRGLYRLFILEDVWKVTVWRSVLGGVGDRLQLLPVTEPLIVNKGGAQANWTVAKFQDHLWERIHEHAKRVDKAQLAAASLVQEDITNTMSDIWRLLPPGFGGNTGTVSRDDVIKQKLSQLPIFNLVVAIWEKYRQ